MHDLDENQEVYVRVWKAILRHVLAYSGEEIEDWVREHGIPLLLSDRTFVLHEEPWFWLCPAIVRSLATDHAGLGARVYENKVFWLLDESIRSKDLAEVDWTSVRARCLAALSQ